MADLNKLFLDYEGLKEYDELIKLYVNNLNDNGGAATEAVANALEELKNAYEAAAETQDTAIAANKAKSEANEAAITKLNGDADTEGSVLNTVNTVVGEATQEAVDQAIADLVANAPETLDTLKEIADWIANDETGTAALIARVDDAEDGIEANAQAIADNKADAEEKIADLKSYVDAQDEYYFNRIGKIETLKIQALFPAKQAAGQTAADAIANLEEGKAIELTADQTITDNITIEKDCYIDANGATFEGTVTVPADKEVIIANATFANPVVVA